MGFALGKVVEGMVDDWEPVNSEDKAVKQAYERSISDAQVHCTCVGENADDENGEIAYLVIGVLFISRTTYDLLQNDDQ